MEDGKSGKRGEGERAHAAEEIRLWALDHEEKFGCWKCHRIMGDSRMVHSIWNVVVGYLSGGMLYGKEVERPGWFVGGRKREYRPRLREPSERRERYREKEVGSSSELSR